LELKKQCENGSIDLAEPELLAYELGNSLRYNPNFGMEDTRQALSALEKLQIPTHPLTGEPASRTVESAYLYGLTLYDSAYVALADMMNTTLYTAHDPQGMLMSGRIRPSWKCFPMPINRPLASTARLSIGKRLRKCYCSLR